MKAALFAVFALSGALLVPVAPAHADDDRHGRGWGHGHGHGHGHWKGRDRHHRHGYGHAPHWQGHGGGWVQAWQEGPCRVERRVNAWGAVHEQRHCPPAWGHAPGWQVHGGWPPGGVIVQPPAIVIR